MFIPTETATPNHGSRVAVTFLIMPFLIEGLFQQYILPIIKPFQNHHQPKQLHSQQSYSMYVHNDGSSPR